MPNGLLERLMPRNQSPHRAISSVSGGYSGTSTSNNFAGFANAYATNATVNAGLNLLATQVGAPRVVGKRHRKSKAQIRTARAEYSALGVQNRAGAMNLDLMMAREGYVEDVVEHPLLKILSEQANPFLTADEMWGYVIIDLWLAGNSYIVKARNDLGMVVELWRLRPDRMEIITDKDKVIAGYRYKIGSETMVFPRRDVMQFKARNPNDPYYYGLPRLLPIIDAIDIDDDMKTYLKSFFRTGGSGPGAILTVEGELTDEEKDELRERKRRIFGGPAGAHEWLILDNTKSSFQQLGLDRGLRDALPKEVWAMISAELSMVMGIPGSILGQLIGYESSSYANKRSDWQVLWDVTLTPTLEALAAVVNLSMLNPVDPEFGNLDEVCFDLSSIPALQEDTEALQGRILKTWMGALSGFRESRLMAGFDPDPDPDDIFLVPSNMVAMPFRSLGVEPAPAPDVNPPDVTVEPAEAIAAHYRAEFAQAKRGRPGLLADPGVRATYDRAVATRRKNPTWSWLQVADSVGISERQLRNYRRQFE
jgi:HK97 family phage portal protein